MTIRAKSHDGIVKLRQLFVFVCIRGVAKEHAESADLCTPSFTDTNLYVKLDVHFKLIWLVYGLFLYIQTRQV